MQKKEFGDDFVWGVATAAFQIEGAFNIDGKGASIWDEFVAKNKRLLKAQHAQTACDHYHRYVEDISLMTFLNIPNYRFSISWPRILPNGKGPVNQAGISFYDRLIDTCLENNINPWVTLYHWDLPASLQHQGGWANREVVHWFSDYAQICANKFGDRVKNWMILNEPLVFTGAGYYLGVHAPGLRGLDKFLPAVHHAAICQSVASKIIRENVVQANIGTTFSYTHLEPYRNNDEKDKDAVKRVDALANRLFLEPLLGRGYPVADLPVLKKIEHYMKPGDEGLLKYEMDFIGVQIYTRELIKHSSLIPYINARVITADKRFVHHSQMNWEIYPECISKALLRLSQYDEIKKLIITENGVAVEDENKNGKVMDHLRKAYIQQHLRRVLKAKNHGAKIGGYFVWTLMDNFEWSAGYRPKFGLIHVDYHTQKRTIKESGIWYKEFLQK